MTLKGQKTITAVAVGLAALGGLESLVLIINLDQTDIFLHTAIWTFVGLWVMMALLFDLHLKVPGALHRASQRHGSSGYRLARLAKIGLSAFWDRFDHMRSWSYFKRLLASLLVPGMLFWATLALLYLNFGQAKIQQILVLCSGAGLIVHYWYFKEHFNRHQEKAGSAVFVALTVVKIYTSAVTFGAIMALTKRFCLEPQYFLAGVFSTTFLLMYQAIFQHKMTSAKNTVTTAALSAVLAYAGLPILRNWGYNYFTAAVFWTALYNLLWGSYHYYLDKALTKKAFFEILVITLIIAVMVLSVTNFKARILGSCVYY